MPTHTHRADPLVVNAALAVPLSLPYPVDMQKATFFVSGRVQGVGFRWWVRSRALELGLAGFARNLYDGRVEVCAQGDRAAIEYLGELLRTRYSEHGRPGRVTNVVMQWGTPRAGLKGFREY